MSWAILTTVPTFQAIITDGIWRGAKVDDVSEQVGLCLPLCGPYPVQSSLVAGDIPGCSCSVSSIDRASLLVRLRFRGRGRDGDRQGQSISNRRKWQVDCVPVRRSRNIDGRVDAMPLS